MADEIWNEEEEEAADIAEQAMLDEMLAPCTKLKLADNIEAYIKKKLLIRDCETINCDVILIEKVVMNYIIAKKILSNLTWQDRILCKSVCSTWHSAVQALANEELKPEDFVLKILTSDDHGVCYKQSGIFHNEPLIVFTFTNNSASFGASCKCNIMTPNPCTPPCDMNHCLLDFVYQQVCAPKNCMLTVKASNLSYLPLPTSPTYKHTLNKKLMIKSYPFVCGLYIPTIRNVEFHVINLKSSYSMKEDYYDVVDRIARDNIVKGVVVYVTDKYLLDSFEEIVFLNYFKDVQPNVPYAFGGCIIEDVTSDTNEIDTIIAESNENKDLISDNIISIGIFTVPKNLASNRENENFDMYSLVIESCDWNKQQIQRKINEFAAKVPHFEHSVALKLSCVGRDQRHDVEQDYFRAAFPTTNLIGCYGNGELGLNHPHIPQPIELTNTVKRRRNESSPQFGIMYSYSTVFVYIGWGKITKQGTPNA